MSLGRVRRWFWSARVAVVSFVSMLLRVWCWFLPSRLVFVWLRSVAACAVVSFLRVVGWCLVLVVVLRIGFLFGRSARAVVSYRFSPLFGSACWSTKAKMGKFDL